MATGDASVIATEDVKPSEEANTVVVANNTASPTKGLNRMDDLDIDLFGILDDDGKSVEDLSTIVVGGGRVYFGSKDVDWVPFDGVGAPEG